ncbi:MAG: carbonic anhydrase, partial [Bacteroidota bacterium]|nr:carbonic anhydrase [Bacteroidota bacterium]
MISYEKIFENNQRWVAQKKDLDEQFFEKLAQDQNPDYLYIGCSDSRITAEDMMGASPGEIFVHRNIGNLVVSIDLNVMSVINYAVKYLKVKHIIVCGHYNCGGVRAALTQEDMGILNPWLRNIRDVFRIHREELHSIRDDDKRFDRLVELNVTEQCINVIKTAAVQQQFVRSGYPVVHGWVMDIRTGKLIDLHINFEKELKGIQEIY